MKPELEPNLRHAPRRIIWVVVLAWCAAALAALVASLAAMTIDRSGTVEAARNNASNLWPFWLASAALWLGLSAMWLLLRNAPTLAAAVDRRRMVRQSLAIVGVALAARAAVLITHEPALSDDVYRYIFEGRNLAAGINPYLVRPIERRNSPAEQWPGERMLIDTPPTISATRLVVYGELASPYLPISHYAFGGMGVVIRVAPQWSDPMSSARVFRVGFVLLEAGLIALLLAACVRAGRSPWWAALYAWHPLAIAEIAGSGHQDVLGIALMVGALVASSVAPQRVARWTLPLAAAAVVKPVAALAAAAILRRQQWAAWWRSALIAAVVALCAVAPLWMIWGDGARALLNWKDTADMLAERWAHFGGVYEPVLWVVRQALPAAGEPAGYNLVQEQWARRICMGAMVVACALILARCRDAWRGAAAMLLAVLLLTTTAHPWYALWALALFPLADLAALWVLSLTISWGYVVFISGKGYAGGEEWTVQPWVLAASYAPVFGALVVDLVLHFRANLAKPHAAEIVR